MKSLAATGNRSSIGALILVALTVSFLAACSRDSREEDAGATVRVIPTFTSTPSSTIVPGQAVTATLLPTTSPGPTKEDMSTTVRVSFGPVPNCPLTTIQDYLTCALPDRQTVEQVSLLVDGLSVYCSEEVGEWLPILDTHAKNSVPQILQYYRDNPPPDGAEVNVKVAMSSAVVVYTVGPALHGGQKQSGSCVDHIENLNVIAAIERMVRESNK